ncbi:hypothetical protein [Pelosinus propionicus]|uniref:Uncharacterized protein n=1 Tax=Pelosinus propionicus DSM 13327 TaxID=1123291 RepID=A0A1I4JUD3_9FIRM|nr:hypothetical protein [Pelosinus propionicus]SFL70140.1 hypothetical protein SAMN04490355_101428 [Pelosinus propionicus DSM 13327]
MRTLQEIRNKNNSKEDFLVNGLENKKNPFSLQRIAEGKKFYYTVVKPIVQRTFRKQVEKGNL